MEPPFNLADKKAVKALLQECATHLIENRLIPADQIPFHILDAIKARIGACPVRVGPSPTKGRGVFATRPVKEGHVLTMYPCHILVVDGKVYGKDASWVEDMSSPLHAYKHTMITPSGPVIQLVGDPEREIELHACGHMINDPHRDVSSLRSHPATPEEAWARLVDYKVFCQATQNCAFESVKGVGVMCVATRDIAEGEEVLAPYDVWFWANMPAKDFLLLVEQQAMHLAKHNFPELASALRDMGALL